MQKIKDFVEIIILENVDRNLNDESGFYSDKYLLGNKNKKSSSQIERRLYKHTLGHCDQI